MIKKLPVLLAVLLLIASTAHGAELKLPADQDYFYWLNYTDADGQEQTTPPVKIRGREDGLDYDALGALPKNVVLNVFDPETGNLAVHPLERVDDELPESVTLKNADFDTVRNVHILVTGKNGKPVESALVTITDAANKTMHSVIEPASLGTAIFQDVTAGLVTVKVNCAGRRSVNDVEIPLERDSKVFRVDLPVPGDVPTIDVEIVSAAVGEAAAGEEGTPQDRRTSPIQTLVGFVFLILVGYVGLLIARAKGFTLFGVLRRAGVQLPGEQDAAPSPGQTATPGVPEVDPNICQFCGEQKDAATGSCGCTVTPAPSGIASGPRLIGIAGPYLGKVFELKEDIITIGREVGNSVSLADDATTSRRHARIIVMEGQFTLQDEGSANGTLVNNARVTEPTEISAGDEIQIGSTKFRFEQ